jgi:RNA-directed DNA polymerase
MIHTVKHLCYIIKIRPAVLEEILRDIDQYYWQKMEIKLKKDGTPRLDAFGNPKQRVLYPSKGLLKIIQKRILIRVLKKIDLPDYAYGAVKGRDNIKNAARHLGKKHIFSTDLKDFFPSISHHQVFRMYCQYGFSPSVASILTKLTTYKGVVPQGIPTSATIANLVFVPTGNKIDHFAKLNGLVFTSFIDDLNISSPVDFKHFIDPMIKIIQNDGYKVAFGKTKYRTKNPEVTGVEVKNNSLALTPAYKKKLSDCSISENRRIAREFYANRILNYRNNKNKK